MTTAISPVETRTIRVVLVDDHPLIRDGLSQLFDQTPDIALVGYAADGTAAVAMCRRTRPDVVLMDLRMPGIDGIEATRRIVADQPGTRVLLLTSFPAGRIRHEGRLVGAVGCLGKDDPAPTILEAIRRTAASRGLTRSR